MAATTAECANLSCNSNFQEETACEAVDLLTPFEVRSIGYAVRRRTKPKS